MTFSHLAVPNSISRAHGAVSQFSEGAYRPLQSTSRRKVFHPATEIGIATVNTLHHDALAHLP